MIDVQGMINSPIAQLFISSMITAWTTLTGLAYTAKIPVTIIMVLLLLAYRFVTANLMIIHRYDKIDWGIFGALLVIQVVNFFVKISWLWTVIELLTLATMFIHMNVRENMHQFKNILYGGNVIYEDNSDRYDPDTDSEMQAAKKRKNANIKRTFTFDRVHVISGIPILVKKFTFRLSPTYTNEQIGKVLKELNKYYSEYNWRGNMTTGGQLYDITAEQKTDNNLVLKFDKEISDELDWCVIPLGAIDVSNKKTAKETPYVWMMHDPKTEKKTYKCLEKTKLFPPAPHGFVVGQTGGGKSVLLNTIIAHFVNKSKHDKQTKLYLADAKRVEFRPYESLEEVEGVAVTLEEAVALTDNFVKEMEDRNIIMEQDGAKNLPLNGKVHLKKFVAINGKLVHGDIPVEFKTSDGVTRKDRAKTLLERNDVVEVNIPDVGYKVKEQEQQQEEEKSSRGGRGGYGGW